MLLQRRCECVPVWVIPRKRGERNKDVAGHETMDSLKLEARDTHARVCDPGTSLVWGEGKPDAAIAIVGEAPGAQEDRVGRPFVGQAGQLLERELAKAGISRDDVYITNVVKCRPTSPRGGTRANRPPTAREITAWRDLLMRELEVVSPRVILCFGTVAASTLIHPRFAVNAERGRWFSGPFGSRAMATFHPAYLLRRQRYGLGEELRLFRDDLEKVRAAATGGEG